MLTNSVLSILLFFSSAALFGYLLRYFMDRFSMKKQTISGSMADSSASNAILDQQNSNKTHSAALSPAAFIDTEGIVYQLQCQNNQLKKSIEVLTEEKQLPPINENEDSKIIIKELLAQKESLQKNNDDLTNTLASLESQFRDLFEKSSEKTARFEEQIAGSTLALTEQTAINETLRKQVDELYEQLDKKTVNPKLKVEKNGILAGISTLSDPIKNVSNNVKVSMTRLRNEEKEPIKAQQDKERGNGYDEQLKQASLILGLKVKGNDLKLIEGIGPKIEALFHKSGIKTWRDLATTTVARCREILQEGGERFQIHNPSTWPRQSKLLADGKWKQLKEYQLNLSGGRESVK